MKWMGIAGALSLALLNTAHANEVVIPGSFAVSESGGATYSIDIDVPPGAAGIEPKLSLTYSSQGGNGLLGMGWSLSGLSSITRCPKTVAQDGVRGAVRFNADDRFCLDGQRLIATSGTYGASGTEYRTEMEGFSRITSTGTTGTGPTSFTVETKSGLTMEYGVTTDSRLHPNGNASVMTWTVNRIEDTVGNHMTVTYFINTAESASYPSTISYTGNGATAPSTSVSFSYEVRNDMHKVYHAGAQVVLSGRLKDVTTRVGASTISKYTLAYDYSPHTQRSRLTSVEKCDGAGNCLPKAEFAHPASVPGLNFLRASNVAAQDGAYIGYKHYLGDFNGDGLTDIMWDWADTYGRSRGARLLWMNIGGGAFAITQNVAGQNNNFYEHIFYPADFNGDGFTDFMTDVVDVYGRSGGHRHIWQSNGDGTFTVIWNVAGQNNNFHHHKFYMGDFNGDGLTDVLTNLVDESGNSLGHRHLWTSNGDGTFAITWHVAGQANQFIGFRPYLGDFDGDGRTDLMWDHADAYGRSQGWRHLWMNDGDGTYTIHWNVAGQDTNFGQFIFYPLDFNGDGKTDFMADYVDIQGRSLGHRHLWQSLGNGTFTVIWNVASQNTNFIQHSFSVADFNGDGLTDILTNLVDTDGRSLGHRHLWQSNGDGTFNVYWNLAGQANQYIGFIMDLADFSGDGLPDIFFSSVTGNGLSAGYRHIWTNIGEPKSDAIASIDDGFGAKVQLTYKPLTDSSVYTKATGAAYPEIDLQVPSYVVSRAEVRDGIGGFVPTEYRYGGLKARADGRGSLGFAWTEAEQVETDFVTRREYRQDYPYVGRVSLERTSAPNVGLAGVLSEKTYSFACLNPANGLGCVEAAGNRYFPYASSIVEKGWDLDGSVLPVVTTTNAYDSWGNATQIDVATSDGFSKSTTNTYTNDTVNWILGRLTRTEVTDVSP